MLIQEVCRAYNVTKKAIEYYIEQGLLSPDRGENRYRHFSASDVERLKKIVVLRGLGLSVSHIQTVLNHPGKNALRQMVHQKGMELSQSQEKHRLMEKLVQDNDWDDTRMQLETLAHKQAVIERFLDSFPGYYGQYLSLYFAPYLNEPVTTMEQQEAFETIVHYLDGVNLVIPEDLKEYMDQVAVGLCGIIPDISKNLSEAVTHTEQYLADNKEILAQYRTYMESEEYKQSPACKMKAYLTQFNKQSGYNDIFIPAMVRLSSSYRAYQDNLLKANEIFLKQYGDIEEG